MGYTLINSTNICLSSFDICRAVRTKFKCGIRTNILFFVVKFEYLYYYHFAMLICFSLFVFQCHLANRCQAAGQILPERPHDGLCGHLRSSGEWAVAAEYVFIVGNIQYQVKYSFSV